VRWRVVCASCAALLVVATWTGCIGPPRRPSGPKPQPDDVKRLENQLAEVSTSVEDLLRRLEELDTRTRALGDELARARRHAPLAPLELQTPTAPPDLPPADKPMSEFQVVEVSLGMLTGSANWDGQPGDDGVMVYLYPLDGSGDIVKRAGDFTFELFDLARRNDHLVATWHVAAAEAADLWLNFPGCYRFKLAWPGPVPSSSELMLKATVLTLPGEEFIATKRLRVHPADEELTTE